ncbi:hypothetical protein [Pedobacter caeni]|uniref:Uncharacterized protein n=1 Tax=Pedobacter caeni TaxID=288992 RepID=A0A1M5PZ83_9SPHI|nr:hypothetical protein [Pedobacter caeni]SHH07174.1 hypothetical protein SAMN04488522_1123 [Pedobacter caeni]
MSIAINGENRPQIGTKFTYRLFNNLLIQMPVVKWALFEGTGKKPMLEKTVGEFTFNQKALGKSYTIVASYLNTFQTGKTELVKLTVQPVAGKPVIQKVSWQDVNHKELGGRPVAYMDQVNLVIQTANIPKNDKLTITVFEDEYEDGHGDSSRNMGTYTALVMKNGQAGLIFPHLNLYQKKLNGLDYLNESEHEFYVRITYDNKIEIIKDKIILKVKNELKQLIKPDKSNNPATVKPAPENPNTKVISAQCIVQFRPKSNWDGSHYGFDWIREGDSGLPADIIANIYEKIIGKYDASGNVFQPDPTKFTLLKPLFYPVTIPWKMVGALPKPYYVPWLSLFLNATASIKMLIEVKSPPERLKIRYLNAYFELNVAGGTKEVDKSDKRFSFLVLPAAAKAVTAAGANRKLDMSIKCIKEFNSDIILEVYAEEKQLSKSIVDKLAGKMNIVANQQKYTANVVFVNMTTLINGGTTPASGYTPSFAGQQKQYLEKFIRQALITPNIETANFNLAADATLITDYVFNTPAGKMLNKYHNSGSGASLVAYLEAKFNAVPANSRFLNYYKIFFFGDRGGYYLANGSLRHLGGYANGIPSKSAVMFSNPQSFYVTHELMHCMELSHSFDNSGRFTFKQGLTENIMDYSHIGVPDGAGGTTPILPQISTWKWQWAILQRNVK